MRDPALLILLHQCLFQGMFLYKNMRLARKLGTPIRGFNREANLAIVFFIFFIGLAVGLALMEDAPGSARLLPDGVAQGLGLVLLLANLWVGLASLRDLGDSWRVGVIDEQRTQLVETGIYRHSRNPYFVSYFLMFAAYTVLLQNLILLSLTLVGCGLIHTMVLREEAYLDRVHGDDYRGYRRRVPRYLLL